VALFHWCYLPRQGIDFGAVSYSQQTNPATTSFTPART
jgi:hypothetical protein